MVSARVARLAAALLLVPLVLLISLPVLAADHVLVVNHTGDGGSVDSVNEPDPGDCAEPGSLVCAGVAGDCSLRQAIQCANLWGALNPPQSTRITFGSIQNDPTESGYEEIVPDTPLPPLTAQGLELDGFECESCAIDVDGSALQDADSVLPDAIIQELVPGLTISGAAISPGLGVALLEIQGSDITVSGLVLVSGSGPGIEFKSRAGSGPPMASSVLGCFIGTNPEGDSDLGNVVGVLVSNGSGLEIHHNLISGNEPGAWPSGSTRGGIDMRGGHDTRVYSNLIGTNADASEAVPNGGSGVRIGPLTAVGEVVRPVIGGEESAEGNWIGGNLAHGVRITGNVAEATVRSNLIGGHPNEGSGIRVEGRQGAASSLSRPESTDILQNTIVSNGGYGLSINGADGVEVAGNAIGTDYTLAADDCNEQGGIFVAGDELGDSSSMSIGAHTESVGSGASESLEDEAQNLIYTCDAPGIVVQVGDAPGEATGQGSWGGGLAAGNQIAFNSFYTGGGGAPSIDFLGWDEGPETLLGPGPDWEYVVASGATDGECPDPAKLPPWANNMVLAPRFDAWIAPPNHPSAGSLFIEGIVCSAARVDFFVQFQDSGWLEPVMVDGDTAPIEEFSGPELNEFKRDPWYGADVAEGDTLFALAYSSTDGSSELSVGVQVRPCDLSVDADGDGFAPGCGGDCDDGNFWVHPERVEVCDDGIDNDCEPETGDVDNIDDCASDLDGDGFAGHEQGGLDCNDDPDDLNADGVADGFFTNPGADEVCDGEDNNCDGEADEGVDTGVDADGDGATCGEDCDDGDELVYPEQVERCGDEVDNDCDEEVDEGDCEPELAEPWRRPPGCLVSCNLGDPGDSAGSLGLALAMLGLGLRRRRRGAPRERRS